VRKFLLAALLVLVGATSAAAQNAGVRVGVSGSPDQFYFGLHYETEALIEQVHFRPNLEVGVGNDQTLVAINLEFVGKFPIKREPWTIYVGAGPALVIDRVSNNAVSNTNSGGGFNILLGAEHSRGLFTELKVGMIDSPSVKFAVGYIFGH
jgi:hypothetical protein